MLGHQILHAYLDTGSDVVWLPCARFLCILCEDKALPPFHPFGPSSSLSAVPCNSIAWSTAHSSASCSDLCAIGGCHLENLEMGPCRLPCPPFFCAYADGSLIARLVCSHLPLPGFHLRNFTFGCAHSALAEPVGVAGFGRGLSTRPFSYGLVPHQRAGAVLVREGNNWMTSVPKLALVFRGNTAWIYQRRATSSASGEEGPRPTFQIVRPLGAPLLWCGPRKGKTATRKSVTQSARGGAGQFPAAER
ncbi:hypothetical protein EJ110_NYTH05069 [Nymphaea thermarum]|nr:hypothetical protein EJ110_NYTH05069 [Nymphaea thermarum]